MKISESDEEVLIAMLNSDNEDDINLALGIVNKMESNRRLLNKLMPDNYNYTISDSSKWYKSILTYDRACYYRKDFKGDIPLYFIRGNE